MPPVWVILLTCVGGVAGAFWERWWTMDWSNLWKKPGLPGSKVGEGKTERVREAPLPFPVGSKVRLKKPCCGHDAGAVGEVYEISVSSNGKVSYCASPFGWFDQSGASVYWEPVEPTASSSGKPVCKEWDTPAKSGNSSFPVETRVRLTREYFNVPAGTEGVVIANNGSILDVHFDSGCGFRSFSLSTNRGCDTNAFDLLDVIAPLVNAKVLHEAKEGMRVRMADARDEIGAISKQGGGKGVRGWCVAMDGGKRFYFDGDYLPDWLEPIEETTLVGDVVDLQAYAGNKPIPAATQADFDPATAGDYWDIVVSGGAVDVEKESLRAEVERLKGELEKSRVQEKESEDRRIRQATRARGEAIRLNSENEELSARCRTLEAITSASKSTLECIEERLWKMLNGNPLNDVAIVDRLMEIERMKADNSI